MFSRRRGSSNPPVNRAASSHAASAASSAFLQQPQSNGSLSSAAAAAALRSHTSSPEPVGSIQTKRMVRRGSTSSMGSAGTGGSSNGRQIIQRTSSNGSMTERTFRTPSPALNNGSITSASPSSVVLPGSAIHRPSSSLERPQRIMSPAPAQGKRSASANAADMVPPGSSRHAKRLSNVSELDEIDKAHSDFAMNFSRRRAEGQPGSTNTTDISGPPSTASKYTHKTGSWFESPSTTRSTPRSGGQPRSATQSPPGRVSAPNTPVQGKRISSAPGSHFARANQPTRIYGIAPGTSYEAPAMIYDASSRTFVPSGSLPAKEASPPSPESPKRDQVYDPHTRTFISRFQAARNEADMARAEPEPTPAPVPAPLLPLGQRAPEPASPLLPLGQRLEPPPKNPARSSPEATSPSSPRAAPVLHKQPSIVREEPEAEQQAETRSSLVSDSNDRAATIQSPAQPSKSYVIPRPPHQRSSSLDVPGARTDAAEGDRRLSRSPNRAAHFSPSPVMKPERHVPPPRDISPVKSAMKHSPASSVRANSPVPVFVIPGAAAMAGPPSESSESPSIAGQDGLGVKKKTVRVSFDEQPHEIDAPTSPIVEDVEDDVVMKPRPMLPSFGSVRRDRVQAEPAEKVTEMPPERHDVSSDHAIGGILRNSLEPVPPEVTSKESAGYGSDESSEVDVPLSRSVVAESSNVGGQDLIKTEPAVTNIRDFATGTPFLGQVVNSDVPAITLVPPTPNLMDEINADLDKQDEAERDDPKYPRNSMDIVVPGGWDHDAEELDRSTGTTESTLTTSSAARRPSAEDSAATMTVTPIQLTHSPLQMSDIDEESDDDAEFSDAVEDPSDLEDAGGFASLDAIVESPIAVTRSITEQVKPADPEPPTSPSTEQAVKKTRAGNITPGATPPSPSNNWGETTAYWSQLSKQRRLQIEREHFSSSDDDLRTVPPPRRPKPKKTQSAEGRSVPISSATQPQPVKSAMKKSMRAQPGPVAAAPVDDGEIHLRQSMRSGGRVVASTRDGAPRRTTSDYAETRSALQKRTMRPASAGNLSSSFAGAAMVSARPQSPVERSSQLTKRTAQRQRAEVPQVSERLQKELSAANDSDSESSFRKRRRAASVDSEGRYSMKRSMRGAPSPALSPGPERNTASPTGERAGTFSRFRSKSPPRSLFGRKSPPPADAVPDRGMKTSLRGPPPASQPSPRPASVGAPASRSKFRSRITDSDSDEENGPGSPQFIPADLTPVRGIPRRQGQEDGDSTDLEEEDDDERRSPQKAAKKAFVPATADVEKAMAAARRNLGMTETGVAEVREGDALHEGTLRGDAVHEPVETMSPTGRPEEADVAPEKKRNGFMRSILRRNRNSASSVQLYGQSSPPATPAIAAPTSPEVVQPEVVQREAVASPSSPSSGKLARRMSEQPRPTRVESDLNLRHYATSPPPRLGARTFSDERPPSSSSSSDVFSPAAIRLAQEMRPDLASRTPSGQYIERRVTIQAGEEGSEPGERDDKAVYSQRTGKKKKFGMLRRAFGLND